MRSTRAAEAVYEKISAKNMPAEDFLASGHRACQGCGEVLALRLILKALGRDTVAVSATGCMEVCTTPYPQSAWRVPWLHVAFENAAAVASGVESAYHVLRRKGKISDKKIPIVAIAGDGGTSDIGLQALSGALERGHEDFIYICLDNEAYMNTGIQRSSATPFGASTTTSPAGKNTIGQETWKKNMPAIAVAHGIPYVATASPSYHWDLMNKVRRAAAIKGPAYIHVYSPCPTGWKMRPELAIESGRLVVQSLAFPLYEVVDGEYTIRKVKKIIPLKDYLKPQGRFRHLKDDDIAKIEKRLHSEFEKLEKLSGSVADE